MSTNNKNYTNVFAGSRATSDAPFTAEAEDRQSPGSPTYSDADEGASIESLWSGRHMMGLPEGRDVTLRAGKATVHVAGRAVAPGDSIRVRVVMRGDARNLSQLRVYAP